MKSGKGEGEGYRKEKKYGSGYMYFSYICNPCFSFFVAREEDHNCTGKDCPICACVHQAKQVLRNLGTTPAVGFFVSLVIFIAETVILPGFWIILSISLVHQKVRLND